MQCVSGTLVQWCNNSGNNSVDQWFNGSVVQWVSGTLVQLCRISDVTELLISLNHRSIWTIAPLNQVTTNIILDKTRQVSSNDAPESYITAIRNITLNFQEFVRIFSKFYPKLRILCTKFTYEIKTKEKICDRNFRKLCTNFK